MDINIAVVFLNTKYTLLDSVGSEHSEMNKKKKRHRWRSAESSWTCGFEHDALSDQSAANQFLIMLWAEGSSC